MKFLSYHPDLSRRIQASFFSKAAGMCGETPHLYTNIYKPSVPEDDYDILPIHARSYSLGEVDMDSPTREYIKKWFDLYFEDVRVNQGELEAVPKLKKYFTDDFELMMYTAPSPPPRKPMSRDALLISFVHPGLQEDILPRHYAIDLEQMIVAVQFEIRFYDKPSGKKWPMLQASAHYHLTTDEKQNLKIRRIQYWTETLPEDLFSYWTVHRDEALTKLAANHINASA
jgi:hypothetical protein